MTTIDAIVSFAFLAAVFTPIAAVIVRETWKTLRSYL